MPSQNRARQFSSGGGGGNKLLSVLGAFGIGPLAAPELDPMYKAGLTGVEGSNAGTGEGTGMTAVGPFKNSGRGKEANAEYEVNQLLAKQERDFTTGRDATLNSNARGLNEQGFDLGEKSANATQGRAILSRQGTGIPYSEDNIKKYNDYTTGNNLANADFTAQTGATGAKFTDELANETYNDRMFTGKTNAALAAKGSQDSFNNFSRDEANKRSMQDATLAHLNAQTRHANVYQVPPGVDAYNLENGQPMFDTKLTLGNQPPATSNSLLSTIKNMFKTPVSNPTATPPPPTTGLLPGQEWFRMSNGQLVPVTRKAK